jgi:hypothetical protein
MAGRIIGELLCQETTLHAAVDLIGHVSYQ